MKKRTKPKVFSGLLCTCKRSFSVFSLFVTVLLLGSASLLAQQANQKTISIDFKDFSVLRALHEINQLGGNVVTFREEVVMKEAKKITLKREKITVFEAVKACLEGTGLTCSRQENGKILVGPKQKSNLIQVRGRIVDEKGNPIAGATVVVYGTMQGVASDAEGRYTISMDPEGVLQISFIGYKTEIVPVKGKAKLNISLTPVAENLEEVTVVAFGEQKKESVVGSITSVRPMDLKTSNSDFTSAFVGKIAGMIGFKQSGLPVALTEDEMNNKFYIRGMTSFQTNANTDPLILLDGVEISKLDLSRLAPEDIEAFSVLKDASATAMYGARGANGVILVTTKKGGEGSVYTTARYEVVTTSPTRKIEVVDPIDYMRYYNEALLGRSPSSTPKYSVDYIDRTASGKYPSWAYPANDWHSILFKDQVVNHHAGITARGGSKVLQYYTSVNYNFDQGMLKTDRLNQFDCNIKNHQFSYRANLNINLKAGIKLLINSSATLDRYHGPLIETQQAYGLAFNVSPVDFAPTYPADENYGWPHLRFGTSSLGSNVTPNPYALIHQGYSERTRFSTINKAEYIHNLSSLVKGLELRLSASLVQSTLFDQAFTTVPFHYYLAPDAYDHETGKFTLSPDPYLGNMMSSRTLQAQGRNSTSDSRVTYEARLYHTAAWGDHQTSVTGVMQMYERTFSPISSVLNGMPQRNLNFSARVSYGYKDRYFIEGNAAYNGSERFAEHNRMGFFPSIGGAWVISKEKWLESVTHIIPYLKLRFSYGKVGNDGVIQEPRYVYIPELGDIESGKLGLLNSQVCWDMVPDASGTFKRKAVLAYTNEGIQWEVAEKSNLGIDFTLFKGIFEVQADIYNELRHHIISDRYTIPASMGIEVAPLDNIGSTRSRGFDLSAKIQHSFNQDFWLILNGTLTYNKVTYKEIEEAYNKPIWQRKKGKEIEVALGYIAEGLFRDQAEIDNAPRQDGVVMPGDIRYRDINNDGVIDTEDATFIGFSRNPRLVYGFSGFLNYKNLEFSFSFQGSGKRTFFMDPLQISPFVNNRAMLKAIADDHWSENNMSKKPLWPRLSTYGIAYHNKYEDYTNDTERRRSTYFMRECRFLRCTSMSLACNLPRKWLEYLKLQSAKFTISANNPFLFSNFKVWDVELGENGFNYPIQKTYSVGLNVSF